MFFDGFKGIEAVGGINANGISMDKDGRLGRRNCDSRLLWTDRGCASAVSRNWIILQAFEAHANFEEL